MLTTRPAVTPHAPTFAGGRNLRTYSHPLAYVRATRGWSQEYLAKKVRRAAAENGLTLATSKNRVWRWERYGIEPDGRTQRMIAVILGVPPAVLGHQRWPYWLPAWDDAHVSLAWSAQTSMRALHEVASDACSDGRRRVAFSGAALAALLAGRQTAQAGSAAAETAGMLPDNQGPAECLEGLRPRILSLRRLGDHLGGGALRPLVHEELALLTRLHSGTHSVPASRQFFSAAAELAQLAGWISFDTGLDSAAQRYYVAALRAAHIAGDRVFGAYILGCMSEQLAVAGSESDAVTSARSALTGDDLPGSLSCLLHLQLAYALSRSGANDEARRARVRALAASGQTPETHQPPNCQPPWLYWFTGSHRRALAARCLTQLGRGSEAASELRAAIDAELAAFPRDALTHLTWLAEAHLSQGDSETARRALEQALGLGARLSSARGMEQARSLWCAAGGYVPAPASNSCASGSPPPTAGPR